MKYVSVAEMIAIEKESDSRGHTYSQMMEHAGRGLAEVTHNTYSEIAEKVILGLIGSGNNGGDTLVAFCYLQQWGWQTMAYIVRSRPDNDPLLDRYLSAGGRLIDIEQDLDYRNLSLALEGCTLLMDGILGTGIRLPLRDPIAEVLDIVRDHLSKMENPPAVVAVDCPSGIDCDNGDAAPQCLAADITVTMAAIKQGMLKFPAYKYVGELQFVSIGLPEGLSAYNDVRRFVVDQVWVQMILPERPLNSHKGTFGTVLIIGGALNYSGAVLLAGEAAFRSGSGWVTLAVPAPLHSALAGRFIEATWLLLPHQDGFISKDAVGLVMENLEKPTVVLIGPGFGMQKTSQDFIANLLEGHQKMPSLVIDADGLKLLSQISDWWEHIPKPAILTPHPGEMSIMTNMPVEEINSNRIEIAERFAAQWGHVVVLKGAFTVIAAPDGRTGIIPVATPALARAGTGDVLAGMIAGLRAQGLRAFESAAAAAWTHARAGQLAAVSLGSSAAVLAGDVLIEAVEVLAVL